VSPNFFGNAGLGLHEGDMGGVPSAFKSAWTNRC
jgi:hypothetical protein